MAEALTTAIGHPIRHHRPPLDVVARYSADLAAMFGYFTRRSPEGRMTCRPQPVTDLSIPATCPTLATRGFEPCRTRGDAPGQPAAAHEWIIR